eukprot:2909714-Amphidinium_carterae.1
MKRACTIHTSKSQALSTLPASTRFSCQLWRPKALAQQNVHGEWSAMSSQSAAVARTHAPNHDQNGLSRALYGQSFTHNPHRSRHVTQACLMTLATCWA